MLVRSSNSAAPAATPSRSAFRKRLHRLARKLLGGYDRWLERQALSELDERMLKDIGLSGAERDRECRRSPWEGNEWR